MGRIKSADHGIYKYWVQEIERAKRVLQLDDKSSTWKENMDYLTAVHEYQSETATVMPVYNELGIACSELQVALYPTDPHPGIKVYRDEDAPSVELCENLVLQEMQGARVGSIVRKAIQDNLVADFAIFKVTYRHEMGEMEEEQLTDQQRASALGETMREHVMMAMGQNPPVLPEQAHYIHQSEHRKAQQVMRMTDPSWGLIEWHLQQHDRMARPVLPGGIVLDRISPKHFMYDPEASEWKVRRYEMERDFPTVAELQNDPAFTHTKHLRGLVPSNVVRMDEEQFDPQPSEASQPDVDTEGDLIGTDGDPEHQFVERWKIHDRVHQMLIVIVMNHPDEVPILVDEWPYLDRYGREIDIYVPLVFNEVNDRISGCSDIDKARPAQEKYNEIMSWRDAHVSEFRKRKVLYDQGTLDTRTLSQIKDPNQTFVELPKGSVKNILVFDAVPFPQDAYLYASELKEYIRRVVGVYEMQQAIPKAETATEAQLLNQQQASRLGDRQRKMAEALELLGQSIIKLHKKFTSVDVMIRMEGSKGVYWRALKSDAIPDEFLCSIDVDGWYSGNPDLRTRQFTEILPHLMKMPLDQEEIALEALRRQNISNPLRFRLKAPPGPGPKGPTGGMAPSAQPASNAMPPAPLGQMAGNAANSQVQPV